MAERALRGTRLGATSYENDRNTDLAPRQDVAFDCPNGHHFSVPFAAEAELPPTWECRVCGAIAVAATEIAPQTRHSHVGGSSASAAKGTLKWCPFGQSKATSWRGARSVFLSFS